MSVQALVVQPDGTAEMREIEPDLDSLKGVVGGWLEAIHPAHDGYGNWHAYIDEEGKLKGLPINNTATSFAMSIGWGTGSFDYLCGPVVFLGFAPEGEEGDVPPEVVGAAVRLWGLEE